MYSSFVEIQTFEDALLPIFSAPLIREIIAQDAMEMWLFTEGTVLIHETYSFNLVGS